MKKHIRMLTDIAAFLAVVLMLTVALLPAAAVDTDDRVSEESQSTSEPQETPAPETTTEPAKTSQTSQTTTAETTTEDTTSSTTAPPTTAQTAAPTGPSWTEQPASGVMYVNTDGISSVEVAQIGSKKIKQYSLNDAVTVVAITNTDYYKLEDGTFIHADFLSTSETVITAEEETTPPDTVTEDIGPPVSETGTEAESDDTPDSEQEPADSE